MTGFLILAGIFAAVVIIDTLPDLLPSARKLNRCNSGRVNLQHAARPLPAPPAGSPTGGRQNFQRGSSIPPCTDSACAERISDAYRSLGAECDQIKFYFPERPAA